MCEGGGGREKKGMSGVRNREKIVGGPGGGPLKNICVPMSGKEQKRSVCVWGRGGMKNRLVCVLVLGGGGDIF